MITRDTKREFALKMAGLCADGLDVETAHRLTSLVYSLSEVKADTSPPQVVYWEGNPRKRLET